MTHDYIQPSLPFSRWPEPAGLFTPGSLILQNPASRAHSVESRYSISAAAITL
jgi:hypothetical protein